MTRECADHYYSAFFPKSDSTLALFYDSGKEALDDDYNIEALTGDMIKEVVV